VTTQACGGQEVVHVGVHIVKGTNKAVTGIDKVDGKQIFASHFALKMDTMTAERIAANVKSGFMEDVVNTVGIHFLS